MRLKRNRLGGLVLLSAIVGCPLAGQLAIPATFNFVIAKQSCSQAHCDAALDDAENMIVPTVAPLILTRDAAHGGSGRGLGATSNGTNTIAASYHTPTDALVVYDRDGNIKWSSGNRFDSTSSYSVPIVDVDGRIIMADDKHIGFFNPDGSTFTYEPTPGGIPISPVLTQNGTVVLVTKGGPLSAYSVSTGRFLGAIYPQDGGNPNYYQTVNTPCVVGNRVYVSMALRNDPENTARLYAFDIRNNATAPIVPAWYYTFGGPSGTSPLCASNVSGYQTAVYFDGQHVAPGNVGGPTVFGVADTGGSGVLLWTTSVPGKIMTNMPLDASGGVNGLWYYSMGYSKLVKLSLANGQPLQVINTASMLGPGTAAVPSSVMSMAVDTNGNPTMLLSIQGRSGRGGSYLAAINTKAGTLTWKMVIADNASVNQAHGQFPLVVNSAGNTVVAFTSYAGGLITAGHLP